MILQIPVRYTLGVGWGEADNPAAAFDSALVRAGMADLNLLRVNTILPPGAARAEKLVVTQDLLVFCRPC